MRIIRLCTLLDFGGLEQRLVTISKVQDEHEWIFCALGTGGEASRQIEENGKRVVLLESKYTIPSLQAVRLLVDFFRKENPDVVHTSGAEANFHGIIAAQFAGIKKLVAEDIGIPNQKYPHRIVFRLLYKFPSFVLANALPVWQYLSQNNGVSPNRLRIIPNPIDFTSNRTIERSHSSEFQILTVSRLKAVKNIEGVLRVLARLKMAGYPFLFTIIGEGDHFEALMETVVELGLQNEVHFKGYLPDPFSSVEVADLFILNSFTEGFSNALAEAMSSGIPCLATNVGAASDMIQENKSGWLIKPNDDKGLFEKLRHIFSLDREILVKVGETGKESIKDKYSLQVHLDQLMEIYSD